MGGPERLAKHHGKGKLDAAERIEHLLDPGSFREIGTLVGGETAADGIVVGSGLINGSPVMLGAEDFTTLAGSIGPGGNSKRYRIAELAVRDKIPLVMLLEGAGFRPDRRALRTLPDRSARSGAMLGPGADRGRRAGPVGRTRRAGRAGVRLPHHERSGRDLHRRPARRQRIYRRRHLEGRPRRPGVALPSGVIHNVGDDDESVLDDIRRYLSYFPSSAWSYPSPLPEDEERSRDQRRSWSRSSRGTTAGSTTCARCST